VEESDLRGIHTGWAGFDDDIEGGNGTNSGGSGHLVGFDEGLDFRDGLISQDESDLLLDQGEEVFQLLNRGTEFSGPIPFFSCRERVSSQINTFAHQGIFADHQSTLALEDSSSNLLHLVGPNIVQGHEDDLLVLTEELVQLLQVDGLLRLLIILWGRHFSSLKILVFFDYFIYS